MGTIAEKLNYSLEAKELIKDGINYLGGNVTDETTLKEYRDELDSVYNKLPKVSNSTASDNVTLYPTLKGRIDSTLKGQIGQDTTEGYNIFKITNYNGLALGLNLGATVTKETNKIIITTTENNGSGAYIWRDALTNIIENYDTSKTYYFSADVTFANNVTSKFGKESSSPTNYSAGKYHLESSFKDESLVFYTIGTATTITLENIMIAETANKEYEPYTGRNC